MSFYHALLGRALAGGGGSEPVLISKTITSNGTYDASDDNADGYKDVSVSVPNTYTAADEDKVVHNGELVAQTSDTVTQNGTVDTTLISSLLVNVQGGGLSQIGKLTSSSQYVTSSTRFYVAEDDLYIYLFGYWDNIDGATYRTVNFDFPNDFDMTNFGTRWDGVVGTTGYGYQTYTGGLEIDKEEKTFIFNQYRTGNVFFKFYKS